MRPHSFDHSTVADPPPEVPPGAGRRAGARGVVILLAAIAGAAACGQDLGTSPGPGTTRLPSSTPVGADSSTSEISTISTPYTPSSDAYIDVVLPAAGIVGQELAGEARLLEHGTPWALNGPVTWKSSDTSVVRFLTGATYTGQNYGSSVFEVVGAGLVTISVSSEGVSGSALLRTFAEDPPVSDELSIDSFVVVTPDDGGFAPYMTLRDRTGDGAVVFGIQIVIPGLGNIPYCATNRPVTSGGSLQLFRDMYGDYELAVSGSGWTGGDATAVVYFLDATVSAKKLIATTPIVPAPYPTAYGGSSGGTPWLCGGAWMPK